MCIFLAEKGFVGALETKRGHNRYSAIYLAGAVVSIETQWLRKGMPGEPQNIGRLLGELFGLNQSSVKAHNELDRERNVATNRYIEYAGSCYFFYSLHFRTVRLKDLNCLNLIEQAVNLFYRNILITRRLFDQPIILLHLWYTVFINWVYGLK